MLFGWLLFLSLLISLVLSLIFFFFWNLVSFSMEYSACTNIYTNANLKQYANVHYYYEFHFCWLFVVSHIFFFLKPYRLHVIMNIRKGATLHRILRINKQLTSMSRPLSMRSIIMIIRGTKWIFFLLMRLPLPLQLLLFCVHLGMHVCRPHKKKITQERHSTRYREECVCVFVFWWKSKRRRRRGKRQRHCILKHLVKWINIVGWWATWLEFLSVCVFFFCHSIAVKRAEKRDTKLRDIS